MLASQKTSVCCIFDNLPLFMLTSTTYSEKGAFLEIEKKTTQPASKKKERTSSYISLPAMLHLANPHPIHGHAEEYADSEKSHALLRRESIYVISIIITIIMTRMPFVVLPQG